jgi:tetratricopeptide (TPR) repeat protein
VPNSTWLTRFDLEHLNFRKAMDWLAETGNADWAMRLGVALERFWEIREHVAEARALMTRILQLPSGKARTRLRARALFAAGAFASDPDSQIALKTEMLDICRELGDEHGQLVALNAIGVIHCAQGNYESARVRFQGGLSIAGELGDRPALCHILSNLANVTLLAGDTSLARFYVEQSLNLCRELGDEAGIASSLNHLGDLASNSGDVAAAEELYEQAITVFRRIGDQRGVAHSLRSLGNAAFKRGEHASAESFYKDSLRMFRELKRTLGVAQTLEAFICCAAAQNKASCALTLAGAAAALRRLVGSPVPPQESARVESALRSAREVIGQSLATQYWNEGWAMQPECAIEFALTA